MAFSATVGNLEAGRQYRVVVPQKLPLGGTVRGTRKPGLFKVYVPTRDGLTLELATTAGRIEVFGPDGQPARKAGGGVADVGANVKLELPEGAFGWYGVLVRDASDYEISAKLTCTAVAVDAAGDPIHPWNFYYFPFTHVHQEGENHPSAKWQKHFALPAYDWEKTSYWKGQIDGSGGQGSQGHGITKEFVEEYNKWAGSKVVDFDNTWWWGHCDAAAVASAIFKQPRPPDGRFTESDLEYYATEIAMRGYSIECRFFLGGLGNTDRRHPSHTEKPTDKAGQALDADIGPFHEVILDVVKKKGGTALMDFRAEWKEGKDQSPDVWNQAVYKITMEAVQAERDTGPGDEEAKARALEFKTVLHANADAQNSGGNPENPAGSGWYRELTYVLHFDAAGKVAANHPQNNFKKCGWARTGEEYYAPRYVFEIKGLNGSRAGPGNPHIRLDLAKQLGLQLRPGFREG